MTASSTRLHAAGDAQDLRRIPSTGLYEPVVAAPGQQMWFLLGNPSDAPDFLAFDQIWSDEASPTHPGHLLFFNRIPSTSQAASVEAELRRRPDFRPPTVTAWAWIKATDKDPITLTIVTLLKTRTNAASHACVDGDAALSGPAGFQAIVFPDGALCIGQRDNGHIVAVATTYSPKEGDPPPNGFGVRLPLGGTERHLVGCAVFSALVNDFSSRNDPTRQRKSLRNGALDPLHPIDDKRNYLIYAEKDFILSGQPGSYRLDPA